MQVSGKMTTKQADGDHHVSSVKGEVWVDRATGWTTSASYKLKVASKLLTASTQLHVISEPVRAEKEEPKNAPRRKQSKQ